MHSIFVSDLHLSPERPHIVDTFFAFLTRAAARAESLYILGDLFEYWVGDDDRDEPFNASISAALAAVAARGVTVRLMQGNRDVLLGEEFARRSRAELIADPTLLDLYGTRTLVMHGDTLCTDDRRLPEIPRLRARSRGATPLSRAAAAGAPPANPGFPGAKRAGEGAEERGDHGRRACRRGGRAEGVRLSAPDTRPHASSGPPPASRRWPRVRALGARGLVRAG